MLWTLLVLACGQFGQVSHIFLSGYVVLKFQEVTEQCHQPDIAKYSPCRKNRVHVLEAIHWLHRLLNQLGGHATDIKHLVILQWINSSLLLVIVIY